MLLVESFFTPDVLIGHSEIGGRMLGPIGRVLIVGWL